MIFILGYITGLLTAVFIFVILAFFRAGIEKRVKIIETKLGTAGPQPTGAIFLPESNEDEVREEYLKKQREAGLDTPISDLVD